MMRTLPIFLAATGLLAGLAWPPNTPGRAMKNVTLERLLGGDSGQNGIGLYNCSDVQAQNSTANDVSSYACTQIPNASLPLNSANYATCVECRNGTQATGRWFTNDGSGKPIVFAGNVYCSGGDLWTAGSCGPGANGFGFCNGPDSNANKKCADDFSKYNDQQP